MLNKTTSKPLGDSDTMSNGGGYELWLINV